MGLGRVWAYQVSGGEIPTTHYKHLGGWRIYTIGSTNRRMTRDGVEMPRF